MLYGPQHFGNKTLLEDLQINSYLHQHYLMIKDKKKSQFDISISKQYFLMVNVKMVISSQLVKNTYIILRNQNITKSKAKKHLIYLSTACTTSHQMAQRTFINISVTVKEQWGLSSESNFIGQRPSQSHEIYWNNTSPLYPTQTL